MNILAISPSADTYGSDEVLFQVLRDRVERSDSIVVLLGSDGPLAARLALVGVQTRRQPMAVLRKSHLTPLGMLKLLVAVVVDIVAGLRMLRSSKPDLVFVNTITAPVWCMLPRLLRIPVVCHVHEIVGGSRPKRLLLYVPLLGVSRAIAVSGAVKRDIREASQVVARKCEVVFNCVFEELVLPPEPLEPCSVTLIGRLSPRKGQDLLVRAAATVRGLDRVHLCGTPFPGYEWYEDELREASHEMDVDRVVFHGYCDRAEALSFSNVVVVPSPVPDPCPLVVFEALSAGKVIVAARSGGIPEILGGAGILVEPGDVGALVEGLQLALDLSPEERAEVRQRSLDRAAELAPERFFDEIGAILEAEASRARP